MGNRVDTPGKLPERPPNRPEFHLALTRLNSLLNGYSLITLRQRGPVSVVEGIESEHPWFLGAT